MSSNSKFWLRLKISFSDCLKILNFKNSSLQSCILRRYKNHKSIQSIIDKRIMFISNKHYVFCLGLCLHWFVRLKWECLIHRGPGTKHFQLCGGLWALVVVCSLQSSNSLHNHWPNELCSSQLIQQHKQYILVDSWKLCFVLCIIFITEICIIIFVK